MPRLEYMKYASQGLKLHVVFASLGPFQQQWESLHASSVLLAHTPLTQHLLHAHSAHLDCIPLELLSHAVSALLAATRLALVHLCV